MTTSMDTLVDPRQLLVNFYADGDVRGPRGSLELQGLEPDQALGESKWFAVYRSQRASSMAIDKMLNGLAVGKALNVKGESALQGAVAGYIPFIAINDNTHKNMVEMSPPNVRIVVYFKSASGREAALASFTSASQQLGSEISVADCGIEAIDDYAPDVYGLDISETLLRHVFITTQDLSPTGVWETGLESKPDFMNMNLRSARNQDPGLLMFDNHAHKFPKVVLYQHDDQNPLNPHGLLMAYAEKSVKPVVQDFDTFLVGSKGMTYEPLPKDQAQLMSWCTDCSRDLSKTSSEAPWTQRWLQILFSGGAPQPRIPFYGFSDPISYNLIAQIVSATSSFGAVRHGAECFNFYFPQELDQEYLIVWNGFEGKAWEYASEPELRSFLVERVQDGFVFPLNPVWLIRDAGWMDVMKAFGDDTGVEKALANWFPPQVGIIEKVVEDTRDDEVSRASNL
jgi:hypothetical protein